ncbi:hypothetical protein [Nocardia sp. NPDC048505]|uniref:hypothetical protein n=1 Tax=unclassified Nocardia TaxID=2637762 RepID=UPI0034017719
MKSITFPLTVLSVYSIVAAFAFATTAAETMLLYPNIFRDVPESLAQTEDFMSVVAVGDVMRPMGAVLTLCALVALATALVFRRARAWVAASLASLVSGQFLLSIWFQWPRASILFDDRDQHSLDEIERAATEFLIGQGFRVAAALATAVFAVAAALTCYRARVLATAVTA